MVVLEVKNPPANAGDPRDVGLIFGQRRSPGVGNGTHSNILAWKIAWAEEPGGLHSIGSQRVGQATGVRDGQKNMVCCSPWDNKESDMTEQLN